MIQCDDCGRWFHAKCIQLVRSEQLHFLADVSKPFGCDLHEQEDRIRGSYQATSMYQLGYAVLRKLVDVRPALVSKVRARSRHAGCIFNNNDTLQSNDRLRSQTPINITKQQVPGLERIYHLLGIPEDSQCTWVVLCSMPGCQKQGAHADYSVIHPDWHPNDPRVSHGCLLAVEDGTMFDVWPGAHLKRKGLITKDEAVLPAIPRTTLHLNKGDAVAFRADCVHAGSAYEKENVRLHCYLDIPTMIHPIGRVSRWASFIAEGVLLDT